MNRDDILSYLLKALPTLKDFHAHDSEFYCFTEAVARQEIEFYFGKNSQQKAQFGNFGVIDFPFISMGAINSTHLFGLDELIIFSFYWNNRHRYKKAIDIGANLGLHSILMSRSGYDVISYEPDPHHFLHLKTNINNNGCENVLLINKAVSSCEKTCDFIRVLGNTTGSHIAGSKSNPYGELETISVDTDSFRDICKHSDFIKIDAEGHEVDILASTIESDWKNTDAIVEIGTSDSAKKFLIFSPI